MNKKVNKLLMIGTILVVIILIFFAIMIVKTVNESKLSDKEITTFNNKFIQYEGNINGEQENDTTKVYSKIVNSYRYKIYREYNNNGLVNKVII